MPPRRPFYIFLSVLALFLIGTVIVLSSVTYYLAIDPSAYLTEDEVPVLDNTTRWNPAHHGQVERIPRIIHQTWKTNALPARWQGISQACRDMMPDYEYMLWTDESSREFIATHYPWFLDTFNDYTYAIQRADAIRYFVLHHYGGVYIDLDIGCLKPMDPLLVYPVILPKTIPVGVSNDLMFAEKGHPFLEQTIHNLVTFDHSWVLNYPTVMFSTGPMFLSAQYGLFASSHPLTAGGQVRILPKSLYGKNAIEGEAPHSFFSHFYGSSWHADDAAFIGFLGTWGKGLMWVGLAVLIIGIVRMPGRQRRSFRRYDILFPRWSHRSGRWHIHVGGSSESSTDPSSPADSTGPNSPTDSEVPVLHLPFSVRSSSPASSDTSSPDQFAGRPSSPLFDAVRRVRTRVAEFAGVTESPPRTPIRPRRGYSSRGVLFFLPAIFTPSQEIELEAPVPHPRAPTLLQPPSLRRPRPRPSIEKRPFIDDIESGSSTWSESETYDSHDDDLLRPSGHSSRSGSSTHLVDLTDSPPHRSSNLPRSPPLPR